jgi:uncharacterized RDD family membrane protein YckC
MADLDSIATTKSGDGRSARELLPFTPGSALGSYRLVRRLGVGGFAEVWEAERSDGTGSVALKILDAARGVDENALQRFLQEGRIAATLSHARTVYIFSAERIDGYPVMTMELMPGGTLQDRLDRGERFTPDEVVEIGLDLLDGLQAAHRMGIVHRDLKPSNCLIDGAGRVKVGDFGISRSVTSETRLTQTAQFIGTPVFSSPEQIRGEGADARSDLYALGATLYALLEGRPPFEGKTWADVVSRTLTENPATPSAGGRSPSALQRIILRLLEKDPARRPQDYDILRADLLRLSARPLVAAGPVRRTAAGVADVALSIFVAIPAFAYLGKRIDSNWGPATGLLLSFLACTAFEWRLGGTPGKLLLGLRIADESGRRIGLRAAALRNMIYQALASTSVFGPLFPAGPIRTLLDSTIMSLVLQVVLFGTMNRRNGYRAVHDLLSGSRVVTLPARAGSAAAVRAVERKVRIPHGSRVAEANAFHLVRRLWATRVRTLSLARDEGLCRDVWILEAIEAPLPKAPPVRPARLRQLRANDRPAWRAYEKPGGRPLFEADDEERMGWGDLRPILVQLISELEAGITLGDLPEDLSFEQLWIDDLRNLRLLEFPAEDTGAESWPRAEWRRFLAALVARLRGLLSTTSGEVLPRRTVALLEQLGDPAIRADQLSAVRLQLESLSIGFTPIGRSLRLGHLLVGQFVATLATMSIILAVQLAYAAHKLPPYGLEMVVVALDLVLLFVVGLPSIALAWMFRGGPALRLFGIQVLDARGRPASRLRCAWRAALGAAPALLISALAVAIAIGHRKAAGEDLLLAPRNSDFESAALAPPAATDERTGAHLPIGWQFRGDPAKYAAGIDSNRAHGGRRCGTLSASTADTSSLALLLQEFNAARFRGHRIRLAAFLRTEGVTHSAGALLRVDGTWRQIASDDMRRRPIRGTTDWTRYDLVLDVPARADKIGYGVRISGAGRVWIDDCRFDFVGPEVTVTGTAPTSVSEIGYSVGRAATILGLRDPHSSGFMWLVRVTVVLAGLVMGLGWTLTILSPDRTLPDRLGRTRLVTR